MVRLTVMGCAISLAMLMSIQGGAVAGSFSALFPHLVDESVVFLSAAGIMEVKYNRAGKITLVNPAKRT